MRENIDTGGPLARAVVVIIAAITELERSLINERVRAGMLRAKLDVVMAWPSIAWPDRFNHFLEVLDELGGRVRRVPR